MRIVAVLLGMGLILAYSALGALVMNDWAVTAASGLSLDATIAEMEAANQPYGAAAGVIFAAIGGTLAVAWGCIALIFRTAISGWTALAIWAGILAFGAPAFFFAAFGNMNSVGDTFADWDAEAAFALEAPLYLTSGIAALVAVAALVLAVIRADATRGTSSTVSGLTPLSPASSS